jgi:SAM-dependent methyltransferase
MNTGILRIGTKRKFLKHGEGVRMYKIRFYFRLFGICIETFIRSVLSLPWFFFCLKKFKKQGMLSQEKFPIGRYYPCFTDRFDSGGIAKGDYFYQDLLVAKRIFINAPQSHYDVGSRVDGFVAHVASFRKISVLDIRPLQSKVENIIFERQDFMAPLKETLKECTDSLSCLHALEHFGLGRYGDSIDYNGYLKGLENLYLMLKPGGKFYFSVPIGEQRVEFNAHRVFSVKYLLKIFNGKYHIEHFSFVDNEGDLHENAELTESDIGNNFGCDCTSGIFEMRKL